VKLNTLPSPIPELERDVIREHQIPNLEGIIFALRCSINSRDPYRAMFDVEAAEREVARIRDTIEHGVQKNRKAAATNSDQSR
jgi:hypothetical protein